MLLGTGSISCICASSKRECSLFPISISSFGGIQSTPGDLLSFIAFIFLSTISGVTINSPKQSDLAS